MENQLINNKLQASQTQVRNLPESHRSTFSINFICRASKASKKNSLSPVEMVINVNSERVYVSLPRKERADEFMKRMSSRKGNETKTFCNSLYSLIQGKVTEMLQMGISITARGIRDAYLGNIIKSYKVSELFKDYLFLQKDRVGVSLTMSVYNKYELVRDAFISHCGDLDVNDICDSTIRGFYNYLGGLYKGSTVQGYMVKLKTVVKYGLDNNKIKSNPFANIKIKKVQEEVEFLTEDEVRRIEDKHFSCERLEKVKDLFLFECYTAISYADGQEISIDDIRECEYGKYIQKKRRKTGVMFTVLLNDKALAILNKYGGVLPKMSNCKLNAYLKEIGDLCGIDKVLTSHKARHTCATSMLNRGLGIDVVSKVLGHTNTTMTKHYAHLLDKSILRDMSRLL